MFDLNEKELLKDQIKDNDEKIVLLSKIINDYQNQNKNLVSEEKFIRELLMNKNFKDGCNLLFKRKIFNSLALIMMLACVISTLIFVVLILNSFDLGFSLIRFIMSLGSFALATLSSIVGYNSAKKSLDYDQLYKDYNSNVVWLDKTKFRKRVDRKLVEDKLQEIVFKQEELSKTIQEHKTSISELESVNRDLTQLLVNLTKVSNASDIVMQDVLDQNKEKENVKVKSLKEI